MLRVLKGLIYDPAMRIIAGQKKGMRLLEPAGLGSRPILDRVKESLFNILATYGLPEGVSVADLFCGVGSLGLEALSRGASAAVFVESDPRVCAVLRQNIQRAGMDQRSTVVVADAFEIGPPYAGTDRTFGLVFIDPPYAALDDVGFGSRFARLVNLVACKTAQEGLVVVRTSQATRLEREYGKLKVIDRREYGKMAVTMLARYTPTVVRVSRSADG